MTDKESIAGLIDNLQQANRLIRSRAVILTLFLILMMGFSLTIEQANTERKQLNASYDKLADLLNPDSMRTILTRDSIRYLYDAKLGSYMSLEVLYDKLMRDSFRDPAPLYAAIDQIDEELRDKIREHDQANISIMGFSTPIRPIMILAPILLLLLYHDFALIMLYRKGLEEKMRTQKIDVWRAGPETVGHYMLGFVPFKFRFVKGLWEIIQMVILFLPIIPAVYFCLYTGNVREFVFAINFICCLLILIDFLIMVDSENILGIRDISLVLSGKKPTDGASKLVHRRNVLVFGIPIFLGLFTWWAFNDLINEQSDLVVCILYAFLAGLLMSLFSLLTTTVEKKWLKALFSALAGGGFIASLFWLVIDLLASLGAIQFRILSPVDYVIFSIGVFICGTIAKAIYLNIYLREQAEVPSQAENA